MEIVVSKAELMKGVNAVSKAIPTRTTAPILECIKIDASTNEIHLTANDTQLGIETIVDGTINERGIIAIPAKNFEPIVHKLPDGEVTITTNETYKTIIKCGKVKFDIEGQSGEDFAPLPLVPKQSPITMSEFTLREVIRQTIFSISDNEERKMMTGEQFKIENNHLKVVSLDGHRISIRNVELKDQNRDEDIVVSGRTLNEVSKIIGGGTEDMVNIYITEVPKERKNEVTQHICFEFGKTRVVSSLLPGEYFSIDHMIPKEYQTKIKLNRKELLECVDRSLLLVKEGDKKPIIMNITDGNVEMMIKSVAGAMDENIDCEKDGVDIKIAFNPKFFIDALRAIDDEDVELYFVNSKSPCSIKDEKDSYLYMILPVNF